MASTDINGFVIFPISITDNIVDELPSNVSSAAGPGEARIQKRTWVRSDTVKQLHLLCAIS